MTLYLFKRYGERGAIEHTEEPPGYMEEGIAHQVYPRRRKVKDPARIIARREDRSPAMFLVRHQRTDYMRRVARADDDDAIRDALAWQQEKWEEYVAARSAAQDAMKAAWGMAKSVTVREAKG